MDGVTEEEWKALLARQVDAMVSMSTSADHLRASVGALTDAVTSLSREVERLRMVRSDAPAE